MGVYIKGMEMPQGCFFCICNKHLDPDTDMCILTRDAFDSTFRVVEHRRDNCPLVPVPPHGRLIDAEKLLSERMKKMYYHLKNGDTAIPIIDIEKAPTIIEASGEET